MSNYCTIQLCCLQVQILTYSIFSGRKEFANIAPKPKKDDPRTKCTKSLAHRAIYQEKIDSRREQLIAALEYCKENNCRGKKALSTGLFPLVKSRDNIDRILDGKTKHPSCAKEYCSILTQEEEAVIVSFIVNKARAYQPVNRQMIEERILALLRLRQQTNRSCKGGRKFKKLSPAAKRSLDRGKLSRKFWERFDTKHRAVLRKKRRGATSMKRVLSCSKEMATEHIDNLAEELMSCGIMENGVKNASGVWTGVIDPTRIFNHDETPQFINYGVDGSANNLFYSGKGERCAAAKTENRECVTVAPMICLTGEMCMCHVIFPSKGLKANMAPKEAVDAIENLLISSTENGFITGKACKKFYDMFDSYLTKNNVKRPVVVLTDGHSSRYDIEVLRFCKEKQIYQFVSPPDTTGLLQPLDQINSMLHSAYRNCVERNFAPGSHVNRESFMLILAEIWPNWASKESVRKSFKRCGISKTSLDISYMQQDKFASADLVNPSEPPVSGSSPSTPRTEKLNLPMPQISSPENAKKGTAAYWKGKFLAMREACKAIVETPISPDEVPDFTRVEKFKSKKQKNFRITQTCGSLAAKDILSVKEKLVEEEMTKQAAAEEKKKKKERLEIAFMRCKDSCKCDKNDGCEAKGLKQCPYCKTVMKSQCSKAQCKTASGITGKPVMIVCAQSAATKGKRAKGSRNVTKSKKSKYDEIYGDSSDSSSSSASEDDSSDEEVVNNELDNRGQLMQFWKSVSPPVNESSIKGKWFAAIYNDSNKKSLYIGRAIRRFLIDDDGEVTHLELDCLKPRVGNVNILDGYPPEHDGDKYLYPLEDVLGGPLDVVPVPRKRSWRVVNLDKIETFFETVKNEDRQQWLKEFRELQV